LTNNRWSKSQKGGGRDEWIVHDISIE
jgi:hypothetical protein